MGSGWSWVPPPQKAHTPGETGGPASHCTASIMVGTSGSIVESGVSTRGGITQEYLTQGKGKDFGNPFRDITAQERNVEVGVALDDPRLARRIRDQFETLVKRGDMEPHPL